MIKKVSAQQQNTNSNIEILVSDGNQTRDHLMRDL